MRKCVLGNRHVNLTNLKNNEERDVDYALKDWVKSKFTPTPFFPSVFNSSSTNGVKRKMFGERSVKRRKTECLPSELSDGENATEKDTPATCSPSKLVSVMPQLHPFN